MLNEEMGKKFEKMSKDENAVRKYAEAKNMTEKIDVLNEYGIVITEEELAVLENTKEQVNEELSEESLSKVAGGILLSVGCVVGWTALNVAVVNWMYQMNKHF